MIACVQPQDIFAPIDMIKDNNSTRLFCNQGCGFLINLDRKVIKPP